jgi:hypothetical protein
MKKYRLKEEVKKYLHFNETALNQVLTLREWERDKLISLEALEEVKERIELYWFNGNVNLQKRLGDSIVKPFTDQEKQLCEAILNASDGVKGAVLYGGELLDIDSLNIKDFNHYLRGTKYYLASRPILNFVEKDLMEVFLLLKQYLKEKK